MEYFIFATYSVNVLFFCSAARQIIVIKFVDIHEFANEVIYDSIVTTLNFIQILRSNDEKIWIKFYLNG